jgi:hypothetical protein
VYALLREGDYEQALSTADELEELRFSAAFDIAGHEDFILVLAEARVHALVGLSRAEEALELGARALDAAAPCAERRATLAALARSDDDARALLAACLHQSRDPQLQALAVATWPDADDAAALIRASQWGPTEEVRRAANQRLSSLPPGAVDRRYLAASAR